MADPSFEHRLARLFADAPPAPDAALFARRVEERLELAWTVRRLLIGLAALGSALLAAWQLAGSVAFSRLLLAGQAPLMMVERRWGLVEAVRPLLKALPLPGEIGWLLAGLVLLAAGLVATRMVDEG